MKIKNVIFILITISTVLVSSVATAAKGDINYDGCDKTGSKCSCFNAGTNGRCAYGNYTSNEGQHSHGYYCSCRNAK